MPLRIRTALLAGVATASALAVPLVAQTTTANAAGSMPTITAHMTKHQIRLSRTTVHAGTILFQAVSGDGRFHQLQVARLHKGYTLQQAGADLGKAFSGNVQAVRRIDDNVTFRGGAPAHRSGYPGQVTINLAAGHYYVLDQDGKGLAALNVHGTEGKQPPVPHEAMITAHTYGFEASKLPPSGWLKVRNISDQPHFIAMVRVNESTTRRQVARAASHANRPPPAWVLRAGTDSSVISPYRHAVMHYRLPAGKYLVACFWPDDDTGMAHFFMGMWKLVRIG